MPAPSYMECHCCWELEKHIDTYLTTEYGRRSVLHAYKDAHAKMLKERLLNCRLEDITKELAECIHFNKLDEEDTEDYLNRFLLELCENKTNV